MPRGEAMVHYTDLPRGRGKKHKPIPPFPPLTLLQKPDRAPCTSTHTLTTWRKSTKRGAQRYSQYRLFPTSLSTPQNLSVICKFMYIHVVDRMCTRRTVTTSRIYIVFYLFVYLYNPAGIVRTTKSPHPAKRLVERFVAL